MKAITAKSPHDSSFSFSRRYFHWKRKVEDDEEEILTFSSSSQTSLRGGAGSSGAPKKKLSLRSALAVFGSKSRSHQHAGLGTRVFGTIFGYRRGHVHFAFQEDPKLTPAFFVELATSTSVLVREMASGLVRIALECEKKTEKKGGKLLDEPIWRTYCNGRKCGYAVRRECGPEEWKVLGRVGPVSMGAGVVPGSGNGSGSRSDGELMYMRAKFERVVGSKDSEAFYMMNPDGHGGPELSIYLLRV
ncbi:protein MIZU-KUSSEI 1-like [Actinidia eriantha]|uniref:protein MIZU-KUSSEI 1-like n=1 Tax=Actinidia eriantha TaxID=165200 RepID=UPI0025901D46|nr:protein MIZU-KUSSEI 1-like [Actinidia eriantha]